MPKKKTSKVTKKKTGRDTKIKTRRNKHMDQKNEKKVLTGETIQEAGNIDKIRDILFGNNMKDMENRMTRFEERIDKAIMDLRDETKKMFESLERFAKEELKTLQEQLKNEQKSRIDEDKSIMKEMGNLEKKLAKHEDDMTTAHRELREQILEQSKKLMDEIKHLKKDLTQTIEKETKLLEYNKTDRSTLAMLLTDLAMQISEGNFTKDEG